MTTLAPTYDFRGHPVRRLTYRGELALLGREIGAALGYEGDGRRFVSQITGPWSAEIREGVHWFRVKGEALRQIKSEMPGAFDRTPEIVLLSEEGVTCALFRTGRPCAFDAWTWFMAEVVGAPRGDLRQDSARADVDALMAAVRALAAAKGIPLKADSGELLAAFRASLAEHGEVLLVDGMPEPTFTTKWANLGGDRRLFALADRAAKSGRPS